MIYVFVTYRCKPGMREAFYAKLKELQIDTKSRAEEGNSRYEYFFSVEEPNSILLAEEWADEATIKKHASTPQFLELQKLKGEYLETSIPFRVDK